MIKLIIHFFKKILPAFFIVSLLGSCYYDNLEELHPIVVVPTCDTAGTISYQNDIVPILTTHCGTENTNCHSANHAAGTIPLGNYQSVFDNAATIVESIKPGTSLTPMPFQEQPLDVCDREKITAWVNRGSLNN